MEKMKKDLKLLKDSQIWNLYSFCIKELKNRKLIRTKNITGERGEFLAIETYRKDKSLPNLQAAPEGTKNIDAISRNGDRYNIKTITHPNKATSAFHSLKDLKKQKFEYLVVVFLSEDYELKEMYEFTWEEFLKLKKWHKTIGAWNLYLSKEIKQKIKKVF